MCKKEASIRKWDRTSKWLILIWVALLVVFVVMLVCEWSGVQNKRMIEHAVWRPSMNYRIQESISRIGDKENVKDNIKAFKLLLDSLREDSNRKVYDTLLVRIPDLQHFIEKLGIDH